MEGEARIQPVDEIQLLRAAANDHRNSRGDIAVFAGLLQHADRNWKCFPGSGLLSRSARLAVTNVKGCIKRLVQRGYIAVQKQGAGLPNIYVIQQSPEVPSRHAGMTTFSNGNLQGRHKSIPTLVADDPSYAHAGGRHADMTEVVIPVRHEYTLNALSNTQEHVQPELIAAGNRFEEFWRAYPRKVKRADAEKVWKSKKLEAIAETIIAAVVARVADPGQWSDPQYIPHPTTYLNGARWEDEWKPSAQPTLTGSVPRESDADAARINAASMVRLGIAA